MKSAAVSLLLCCVFATGIKGQNLSSVDENKYRIILSDYWKPGNKIWKVLTDKLPEVCEELKDKELCGDDCNPKYTVELTIADPVILDHLPNHISSDYRATNRNRQTDNWEIRTLYSFESSLLLRNEKGVVITRLILVDTNEVWSISNRVSLAAYAPAPPVNNNVAMLARRVSSRSNTADPSVIYNQVMAPQVIPQPAQEGETPFAYINRNKDKLVPSQRDMLIIIDAKISSW